MHACPVCYVWLGLAPWTFVLGEQLCSDCATWAREFRKGFPLEMLAERLAWGIPEAELWTEDFTRAVMDDVRRQLLDRWPSFDRAVQDDWIQLPPLEEGVKLKGFRYDRADRRLDLQLEVPVLTPIRTIVWREPITISSEMTRDSVFDFDEDLHRLMD